MLRRAIWVPITPADRFRRWVSGGAPWNDLAERKFLEDLVDELENIVVTQKAEFLVIAAPARAMGMLRAGLGKAARDILKAEITKDLCRKPVAEIEAYLQAMRELA